MTPDDAMLMAYADGELDPIAAKRVERALADDAAAAAVVARHRALKSRLGLGFAPVAAEPVPDRLAALVAGNVVPLAPRRPPAQRAWVQGLAVAATLVLGIMIGRVQPAGPVTVASGQLRASGVLAQALDTRLGGDGGATRMLASFKDTQGRYCRVFAGAPVDGIACHQGRDWLLLQVQAGAAASRADYRQAASADAALMARAQELMAGDPLDPAAERAARRRGWN